MANWFCSDVCVVNVCRKRCRSELTDSAWVVIVPGQKYIKTQSLQKNVTNESLATKTLYLLNKECKVSNIVHLSGKSFEIIICVTCDHKMSSKEHKIIIVSELIDVVHHTNYFRYDCRYNYKRPSPPYICCSWDEFNYKRPNPPYICCSWVWSSIIKDLTHPLMLLYKT